MTIIFVLSSVHANVSFAAVEAGSFNFEMSFSSAIHFSRFNPEVFTIPFHLGEIQNKHTGTSDKFIIHIQDAHLNYYAQKKIAQMFGYLNNEYGIKTINLEGGTGEYDLSVFTDISGDAIREEVADYFLKKGEINAAEYYAINNENRANIWGVEDEDLYLANLRVYRDFLPHKETTQKYLDKITYVLNDLKRQIFSQDQLKMDMNYAAYKSGNMPFKDYLVFLVNKAEEEKVDFNKYKNIYLLVVAMEKEKKIDFKKANTERSVLVEELKKKLSRDEVRELLSRTINYKTQKIPKKVFYEYILKKGSEVDLSEKDFPQLENYLEYVSTYDAVERSLAMVELEELEDAIKNTIYRNDTEKELNELSRNLEKLKTIFAFSMTKNDHDYYLMNPDAFRVGNFLSFINKEAPKFKMPRFEEQDITLLDKLREDISMFYSYSFKRDKAFLENMRFDDMGNGTKGAIIMTGGFHTDNLCDIFEKENITYVSLSPKFVSEKGYENPYFGMLAGETDPLQRVVRSAIARASLIQVASKLNSLGDKVWSSTDINAFKASVALVTIAARNSIRIAVSREGQELLTVGAKGELLIIDEAELVPALERYSSIRGRAPPKALSRFISHTPEYKLIFDQEKDIAGILVSFLLREQAGDITRVNYQDIFEAAEYARVGAIYLFNAVEGMIPDISEDPRKREWALDLLLSIDPVGKKSEEQSLLLSKLKEYTEEENKFTASDDWDSRGLAPKYFTSEREKYAVGEVLGYGSDGWVFELLGRDGEKLIVKRLLSFGSLNDILFLKEGLINLRLKGLQGIPAMLGMAKAAYSGSEELFMVQEYAGTDLTEGLNLVAKNEILRGAIVADIAYQIFYTLTEMTRNGVLHHDIKPGNITYNSQTGEVNIIDFGRALVYPENCDRSRIYGKGFRGTPKFKPDLDKIDKTSEKSDIYASGLTLLYLIDGNLPEDLLKNGEITNDLREKKEDISAPLYDAIAELITDDKIEPQGIWTMAEALGKFTLLKTRYDDIYISDLERKINLAYLSEERFYLSDEDRTLVRRIAQRADIIGYRAGDILTYYDNIGTIEALTEELKLEAGLSPYEAVNRLIDIAEDSDRRIEIIKDGNLIFSVGKISDAAYFVEEKDIPFILGKYENIREEQEKTDILRRYMKEKGSIDLITEGEDRVADIIAEYLLEEKNGEVTAIALKDVHEAARSLKISILKILEKIEVKNPDLYQDPEKAQWAEEVLLSTDHNRMFGDVRENAELFIDKLNKRVNDSYIPSQQSISLEKDEKTFIPFPDSFKDPDGKILITGRYRGDGGFGFVGELSDGEKTFIVKQSKLPGISGRIKFLKEYLKMRRLTGVDNIVEALGIAVTGEGTDRDYYMIQEDAGGDLLAYIVEDKNENPKEAFPFVALEIAQGVLEGLKEMSARGLRHYDIKPQNIFYDRATGKIKIGDLGASLYYPSGLDPVVLYGEGRISGTPNMMSLEAWQGKHAEKIDLYSLGITVLSVADFEKLSGLMSSSIDPTKTGDEREKEINRYFEEKNERIEELRELGRNSPYSVYGFIADLLDSDPARETSLFSFEDALDRIEQVRRSGYKELFGMIFTRLSSEIKIDLEQRNRNIFTPEVIRALELTRGNKDFSEVQASIALLYNAALEARESSSPGTYRNKAVELIGRMDQVGRNLDAMERQMAEVIYDKYLNGLRSEKIKAVLERSGEKEKAGEYSEALEDLRTFRDELPEEDIISWAEIENRIKEIAESRAQAEIDKLLTAEFRTEKIKQADLRLQVYQDRLNRGELSPGEMSRIGNAMKLSDNIKEAELRISRRIYNDILESTEFDFEADKLTERGGMRVPGKISIGEEVFDVTEQLGTGGTSVVYKAVSDRGKEVAVKILSFTPQEGKKETPQTYRNYVAFLREYLVMKKIQGMPGTVGLEGIGSYIDQGDQRFFIVQEFAGESLGSAIDSLFEGKSFSETRSIFLDLARQILTVLNSLHARGIIKIDINANNIFYMDGKIKVGDFGFSEFVGSAEQITLDVDKTDLDHIRTPVSYLASSALEQGRYSIVTDAFAAGVTLFNLFRPYDGRLSIDGDFNRGILKSDLDRSIQKIALRRKGVIESLKQRIGEDPLNGLIAGLLAGEGAGTSGKNLISEALSVLEEITESQQEIPVDHAFIGYDIIAALSAFQESLSKGEFSSGDLLDDAREEVLFNMKKLNRIISKLKGEQRDIIERLYKDKIDPYQDDQDLIRRVEASLTRINEGERRGPEKELETLRDTFYGSSPREVFFWADLQMKIDNIDDQAFVNGQVEKLGAPEGTEPLNEKTLDKLIEISGNTYIGQTAAMAVIFNSYLKAMDLPEFRDESQERELMPLFTLAEDMYGYLDIDRRIKPGVAEDLSASVKTPENIFAGNEENRNRFSVYMDAGNSEQAIKILEEVEQELDPRDLIRRLALKRGKKDLLHAKESPEFLEVEPIRAKASKMPASAATELTQEELKGVVEGSIVPEDRKKVFNRDSKQIRGANKLIEEMTKIKDSDNADVLDRIKGAYAGDVTVVAIDFTANEELSGKGLADEVEALSYIDEGRIVIVINDKRTEAGERIADSYFNNDAAMAHLIRHEFIEAALDIDHRLIKRFEMLENGENALTVLNEIMIGHMTPERMNAVERGHRNDPGDIFYEAVQTEKIARADRGVLWASKPGEYINIVLVPLTENQRFYDGAEYSSLKQKSKRVFSRQYGLNTHVVYYSVDAPETEISGQIKLEVDNRIAMSGEFSEQDKARIVAFTTEDKADVMERALSGYKEQGKLSGVVKGDFLVEKDSERFDVVSLVILGLGLNEWDRLTSAGQNADNIARKIRTLLLRLGDYSPDDDVMKTEDVNLLVRGLLKQGYLMRIKKIDYSEIRRYMEAQAAVLQSL